jgi:hypothetical protein
MLRSECEQQSKHVLKAAHELQDSKMVDVTREDQSNINSFNKLIGRVNELQAQIKAKKVRHAWHRSLKEG